MNQCNTGVAVGEDNSQIWTTAGNILNKQLGDSQHRDFLKHADSAGC
jgi:hypothetical protein